MTKITKPANVLFINLYTEMGGNEYAVLNLAKSMDRSRFTPVIMVNRPGPLVDLAKEAGIQTVIIGFRSVMLKKMIVPSNCIANMKASSEIHKYLHSAKIDIIHCSDILSLFLIMFPVLRLRIPVVFSVVFFYEWLRVALLNIMALFIIDRVVTNSIRGELDLKRKTFFLSKKITSIHPGVDTALFRPRGETGMNALRKELGISPSTKIIGMVARFDPAKDHATFLRTAAAMTRDRSDLQFIVIGGLLMSDSLPSWKRYHDEIMALHTSLGLGNKVVFLNHRNDSPELIRSLDLLVCPSTREAFGLVVLEGVASGVPVVVSKGVGALEAVEHESGVYFAEPTDVSSFVAGITLGLRESDARKGKPLQPSAGFASRASLKRCAAQFENTYSEIV